MEPTAEEFQVALKAISPLPAHHLGMLQAHYRAPQHTITATQIAHAVGYKDWHPVNAGYGTFCHDLAKQMGREGEASDLQLILASADKGESGELDLVMRSTLATALDGLCWSWAS